MEKNLSGCDKVILFAATAGLHIDRFIAKYARISASRSLMFHSIGAERVEALCDAFCAELENARPRFSPGYGDLPLSLQPGILRALDATRQAGVYLTDSLLMNPSKTVTAIVGLSHQPQGAKIRGCASCSLRDTCTIRKDGKRCDSL